MVDHEPYRTARAVGSAITAAARQATTLDSSLTTNQRIRIETFRRFLSRVFSEGRSSPWVLKGGTGLLARVASARSTRDVDLLRSGTSTDDALADLIRLASIDLGDHFYFEYDGDRPTIGHDMQPYVKGLSGSFRVFLGVTAREPLTVDVVAGIELIGAATVTQPASALDLPRLTSYPYRLYPVVDHIADKVCATLGAYSSGPSSREKDLVDLVVIATTQDVDGTELRAALSRESARRHMTIERFTVPEHWGSAYAQLSRPIPVCRPYPTGGHAVILMSRLIDPALSGRCRGKTWLHTHRAWV